MILNLTNKKQIYPKISIIVTAFNQEKNLEKCLNSIIKQSYRNLEIILIDDGSTDNTRLICFNFSKCDERIKFISQRNGGLSAARNQGLKHATGEYITFIDSDDYVDQNLIYNYVKFLKEYGENILVSGYRKIKNNIVIFEYKSNFLLLNNTEALKILFNDNKKSFKNYMWNKLYPSHLFKNIEFEEGKVYEDIRIQYKLFRLSKKIVVCPFVAYNYVFHSSSLTNKKNLIFGLIDAHIDRLLYFYNNDKTYLPVLSRKMFCSVLKYNNSYYLGGEEKNTDVIEVYRKINEVKKILYENLPYVLYVIFFMSLKRVSVIDKLICYIWKINNLYKKYM